MKQIYTMILVLGGVLVFAAPVSAQGQRYVSEDGVELYDVPSQDANIVTMLAKGAALDVLELSGTGYTHVHTEDDWKGWVVNQYLVDTRPFAETVQPVPGSATYQNNARGTQNAQTGQTIPASVPSDEIDDSLQMQLTAARKELEAAREDNRQLKGGRARDWFLAGAGVLILGFVMGIIVPRIQWCRKSWHSY